MIPFFAEVRQTTGFGNISCYAVDLSMFSPVIAFAENFERAEDRLETFLYNDDIALRTHEATRDGWESTYATYFHYVLDN
jgi:retinol dehydrogenase-12